MLLSVTADIYTLFCLIEVQFVSSDRELLMNIAMFRSSVLFDLTDVSSIALRNTLNTLTITITLKTFPRK